MLMLLLATFKSRSAAKLISERCLFEFGLSRRQPGRGDGAATPRPTSTKLALLLLARAVCVTVLATLRAPGRAPRALLLPTDNLSLKLLIVSNSRARRALRSRRAVPPFRWGRYSVSCGFGAKRRREGLPRAIPPLKFAAFHSLSYALLRGVLIRPRIYSAPPPTLPPGLFCYQV